jgi:hypothetical protein
MPADSARDEAAFRQELGANAKAPSVVTAAPTVETVPPAGAGASDESVLDASNATPDEGVAPGASYLKAPAVDAPPLAPAAADPEASPATTAPSEPEDVESVAARRMPAEKPRRGRRTAPRSKLPLLILVLLGVCTAIIAWRNDIVRHAPQMASLYRLLGLPVNVRGLVFTDMKIASEMQDGVPVLMVEGTIMNAVTDAVEVPRLRFALRNRAGQEVYSWTAMPTQMVLPPGESLPFRSRLASPPGDVQDVQVRFFNRRDAAGGN